jgi:hypothetical protein
MSGIVSSNVDWSRYWIQGVLEFGSERRPMAEIAEPVAAEPEPTPTQPRWELVECACPDWCERDHEQD